MAVIFELVTDFGQNEAHAQECWKWLAERALPITVDSYEIAMHPPQVYRDSRSQSFRVDVLPKQISIGLPSEAGVERIPLNRDQLSRLGNSLYGLLRGAPHYQLAMVGWDVDYLLDFDELNAEWASEIQDGSFSGLVVKSSLLAQLPPSEAFVQFDAGHSWIPCASSESME